MQPDDDKNLFRCMAEVKPIFNKMLDPAETEGAYVECFVCGDTALDALNF